MNRLLKLILLLALLLLPLWSRASLPDYSFRRYNMSSGLASDMIGAIFQSSDGLIWVGTGEGVSRFDGRQFRNFRMSSGGNVVDGLSVSALAEDRNGNLWAGSDNGLFYLKIGSSQDVFERINARTAEGHDINTIITSLAIDRDGVIWVSTRGQGVMRYNPATEALDAFPADYRGREVESVYVDSSNNVWAAFTDDRNAICIFNRADSIFSRIELDLGPGVMTRIGVMLEDSASNLWFGSWDQGIFMYDHSSGKTRRFNGDGTGFTHIHSMMELVSGEFLIGSDDGLLWYNVITDEARIFRNNRGDASSLSNKFVYPVVKDMEGGVWVGTYYGGINYAAPNTGSFSYCEVSDMIGTSEDFIVSSFAQDPDGSIWVGSDNKGLVHYLDKDSVRQVKASAGFNIQALWADSGHVWMGTYGSGLVCLDKHTGVFKAYSYGSGLDDSSVYAITCDRSGRLIVATGKGFFAYDGASDSFRNLYSSGSICYDIKEAPDGDLWFATVGRGIFRLCSSDGTWRTYSKSLGNSIGDAAHSFYCGQDGNVYAATSNGLARYDVSSDSFIASGLEDYGSILYVSGDGEHLWATSPSRLLRYSLADGTVTCYDSGDGIVNAQFLPNSGLMSASGRILIGSAKGFNSFVPQNITVNEYVPPVLITSFQFRDRQGSSRRGGDVYHTMPQDREGHVLSWRRNDVRFSFVSLSYCSPQKNRYRYMLEGFDAQWTEADDVTSATYTNLPAGKYCFRVIASNNDGKWNDEGGSLEFRIKPHFMKTTLARIIYALLLLAMLYSVLLMIKARSEKKLRLQFEARDREREEQELESKANFLTSIAHEVRTPLSLIIAPVERLKASASNMSELDRNYLEVIDRNCSRLGKLINQILDFSRLNASSGYSFSYENGDVNMLVRSVSSSFLPTFEKKGIAFREEYLCDTLMADIDDEALTKIVMNLLSNATKYTTDRVELSCGLQGDFFSLKVSDNGPGISEELRGRIFHPFFRVDESSVGTGLGLSILKSLVDAQGGFVSVTDAPGGGSLFEVLLPVSQPDAPPALDAVPAKTPEIDSEVLEELGERRKVGNADRPTILIVEDDEDMRSFLVSDFREKYNILEAVDAENAERLLFQYEISLIISDWMMPGKSGADLCRFVRSRKTLCQLPFILLTAKSDDASQLESLDCGADAHVKKPFSPEHLRALVAHLLRMRDMLARRYTSVSLSSVDGGKGEDDFFSRLTEIIEANISNTELSVEMLAKELCVSRSGLFSKVKAASGDTPNRLIMDIRLKAAAKMLKESSHSVSEISYMAGFNSPSYFSKCFSAQYGMTPHQWMEKHKNG